MAEEANNALSELKNEVKGAINVRLRTPFAGLFALSWLLVNHRVVFVLFSDMKVGKRFDYIDDELYPRFDVWLSMNFILPLASTVFFLLVMPWVSELVHRWSLWHQRRQKALELRSDGLQLLTEEQGEELRSLIVKRDRRNAELEVKLFEVRADRAVYVCMHEVSIGSSGKDLRVAFEGYFELNRLAVHGADYQPVTQFHSLSEDGYVYTQWGSIRDPWSPETWRLDGTVLLMLTASEEIYIKAEFKAESGFFHGVLHGENVVLKPVIRV